jgi:hypothetical protein
MMRMGGDEHKRTHWKANDTFPQNSGRNPSKRRENQCMDEKVEDDEMNGAYTKRAFSVSVLFKSIYNHRQ